MFTIIKAFLGNMLKSKAGSFVSNIFTTWRVYLLLGVVFGGYIVYLKAGNWNTKRKLTNAHQQIERLKSDNIEAERANQANQQTINRISGLHRECVKQFADASKDNVVALLEIKSKKKANEIKIKTIKERVIVNTCVVSNHNIKLLKEANSQD